MTPGPRPFVAGAALYLGAVACVNAEDRPDDGPATANFSYHVPVPAELEPWATYPLRGVGYERDGKDVQIRYRFPAWLNGLDQRIVLTGSAEPGATSFAVVVEDLGTGSCEREGQRFRCLEVLPGIAIDREGAGRRMEEAGLPAQEIEGRLRVTDSFATDPIGVLTFDLLIDE